MLNMHGEWRIVSTEAQNTTDGNELSAYKQVVGLKDNKEQVC